MWKVIFMNKAVFIVTALLVVLGFCCGYLKAQRDFLTNPITFINLSLRNHPDLESQFYN